MNIIERLQDNKKRHLAFRHFYTEHQIKILLLLGSIGTVHGITGYLWTWKLFINTEKYGKTGFAFVFLLSFFTTIVTLIGSKTKIFKTEQSKEAFFETLSVLVAMGYFAWAFLVMNYSIIEERSVNYITILILYAIATMFMYYSIYHYLLLFTLCVIGAMHQVYVVKLGLFDRGLFINVVILGFVMCIAAMVRYTASLREFEAKQRAEKYRDELKISNDELSGKNKELNNLTNQLIIANDAQKRFTANMNHELRSPLNGTIGLLQILKEDKNLDEGQLDYVNRALESSMTLIQIVNDILDHAKIEAGEFKVDKAPFDYREVVRNVIDITGGQAESKGLNLVLQINEDMPCRLISDGVRIQQIITNLVTNGIKYTAEGAVTFASDIKDGKLLIDVFDTGQGISEDSLPYIFDAYKRVNESQNRHIQGTGLGLSIVQSIVNSLGGEIKVTSELGKGSKFSVIIPIEIEDATVKFSERIREVQIETEFPDFSGLKILSVDDNKVNLTVFNGLIKKTKAKVDLAYGGEEALAKLEATKYDIVFLDHRMPDPDGPEVFRRLRAGTGVNVSTPVIILTANAGSEAVDEYKQIGFDGYLSKPVIKEQLYELTKEILKL